jgi:hypothetical protein
LTIHLAIRMLFYSFSVNLRATMAVPGENRRGTRNLHERTRNVACPLKTLETLFFHPRIGEQRGLAIFFQPIGHRSHA